VEARKREKHGESYRHEKEKEKDIEGFFEKRYVTHVLWGSPAVWTKRREAKRKT